MLEATSGLDKKLSDRKARETGICPVREELYGQCFDELIRQVALDGPERGLLLMRTRDEIRMTIEAYKSLYADSVCFGIQKQLKAEEGVPDLVAEAATLEKENAQLELDLYELRSTLTRNDKKEQELQATDQKRRLDEIDYLGHVHRLLDTPYKQIAK